MEMLAGAAALNGGTTGDLKALMEKIRADCRMGAQRNWRPFLRI